jgi:hypothetical protein
MVPGGLLHPGLEIRHRPAGHQESPIQHQILITRGHAPGRHPAFAKICRGLAQIPGNFLDYPGKPGAQVFLNYGAAALPLEVLPTGGQ